MQSIHVGTILLPHPKPSSEQADGFDAMGSPVPEKRRDNAYQWLRSIEIGREKAWDTVETMAGHIERDHPHEAMESARKAVDLIGAYRLMALLLTGVSA